MDMIPEMTDGMYDELPDEDGDGIADCADCALDNDDYEASSKKMWYRDADGDGYGDPEMHIETCMVREGYVDNYMDCDDTTAAILGEYIFEWLAPDGYKHYVNINNYNPDDGSFSGVGYFIFISHESNWANGNEPLTVYGTYDKTLKTFTGTLDYENSGSAPFNGTASACDGLTGEGSVTIYPYVDADEDGYSVDEGDCDDSDPNLSPGVDADGDGINSCEDCDDNKLPYSPEGSYSILRDNGAVLNIVIDSEGTITGSGYTSNGPGDPQTYEGTVTVYEDHTILLIVLQSPQGG
ncbi:MAG TPA: hypothetical protein VJ970_06545, partial [Flavobacteriaceae bacterium]|nr:hypothetical protein [Flavobacteriaceae bacterium]